MPLRGASEPQHDRGGGYHDRNNDHRPTKGINLKFAGPAEEDPDWSWESLFSSKLDSWNITNGPGDGVLREGLRVGTDSHSSSKDDQSNFDLLLQGGEPAAQIRPLLRIYNDFCRGTPNFTPNTSSSEFIQMVNFRIHDRTWCTNGSSRGERSYYCQNLDEFKQGLASDRLGSKESDFVPRRRAIFIGDPDPPTIQCLLYHTSATRERAAVMAQVLKYLDTSSRSKIKLKLVRRQFQLSFQLPYLALGEDKVEDSRTLKTCGRPLRQRFGIPSLRLDESNNDDDNIFNCYNHVYESQISLLVCGVSNDDWTAYFLCDEFFQELSRLVHPDDENEGRNMSHTVPAIFEQNKAIAKAVEGHLANRGQFTDPVTEKAHYETSIDPRCYFLQAIWSNNFHVYQHHDAIYKVLHHELREYVDDVFNFSGPENGPKNQKMQEKKRRRLEKITIILGMLRKRGDDQRIALENFLEDDVRLDHEGRVNGPQFCGLMRDRNVADASRCFRDLRRVTRDLVQLGRRVDELLRECDFIRKLNKADEVGRNQLHNTNLELGPKAALLTLPQLAMLAPTFSASLFSVSKNVNPLPQTPAALIVLALTGMLVSIIYYIVIASYGDIIWAFGESCIILLHRLVRRTGP